MEKLTIQKPILVEGRYDKILLSSVLNATIIPLGGFCIFKQQEKAALLRRLAREHGLIVLTDPDSGGRVIRSHLRSILPKDRVTHLYIPAIKGKESRKAAPSKEGLLGVEGMNTDTIRALFAPFAVEHEASSDRPDATPPMTKADFFELGLSGRPDSTKLRDSLAVHLSLPPHLTASALLEAINLLSLQKEVVSFLEARKEPQ